MDSQTFALILAWVVIVLLSFGMSALLRDVRLLQASSSSARMSYAIAAGEVAPSIASVDYGGAPLLLLFADGDCRHCEDAVSELEVLPADLKSVIVVKSEISAPKPTFPATVVVAPSAFETFRVTAIPTAVLVDSTGRVVTASPVGGRDRFRMFMRNHEDFIREEERV